MIFTSLNETASPSLRFFLRTPLYFVRKSVTQPGGLTNQSQTTVKYIMNPLIISSWLTKKTNQCYLFRRNLQDSIELKQMSYHQVQSQPDSIYYLIFYIGEKININFMIKPFHNLNQYILTCQLYYIFLYHKFPCHNVLF